MYGTPQTAIEGRLGSSFPNMTAKEVTAATAPTPLSPVSQTLATQERLLNELHQTIDTLHDRLVGCLAPLPPEIPAQAPEPSPPASPLVQGLDHRNGQIAAAVRRLRTIVEAIQL